jgi:hypothetical protein
MIHWRHDERHPTRLLQMYEYRLRQQGEQLLQQWLLRSFQWQR